MPERAPRPNPRDPGLFVERESLKCVLQVPDLVGDWFDSVQSDSFRHPRCWEPSSCFNSDSARPTLKHRRQSWRIQT